MCYEEIKQKWGGGRDGAAFEEVVLEQRVTVGMSQPQELLGVEHSGRRSSMRKGWGGLCGVECTRGQVPLLVTL